MVFPIVPPGDANKEVIGDRRLLCRTDLYLKSMSKTTPEPSPLPVCCQPGSVPTLRTICSCGLSSLVAPFDALSQQAE
jgi:hypothetical protein